MNQIDWQQHEEQDRISSARHESAHATVAHHFRIPWRAWLIEVGPGTIDIKACCGKATIGIPNDDWSSIMCFRRSCIGWAGPLADYRDEDECGANAEDWAFNTIDMAQWLPEDISETDREFIESHPQQWRACKTAAGILWRHRTRWEWIQNELLTKGATDQGALLAAKV
jgi:hypothetical protein